MSSWEAEAGDIEEGVEGCVGGFGGEEFVSEAEDFVVFFCPGGGKGEEEKEKGEDVMHTSRREGTEASERSLLLF